MERSRVADQEKKKKRRHEQPLGDWILGALLTDLLLLMFYREGVTSPYTPTGILRPSEINLIITVLLHQHRVNMLVNT